MLSSTPVGRRRGGEGRRTWRPVRGARLPVAGAAGGAGLRSPARRCSAQGLRPAGCGGRRWRRRRRIWTAGLSPPLSRSSLLLGLCGGWRGCRTGGLGVASSEGGGHGCHWRCVGGGSATPREVVVLCCVDLLLPLEGALCTAASCCWW